MAKAKRRAPDKHTLRELYLKSGNQCAFPGCSDLILNSDGEFIGQICHIEAAEDGGERFNKDQTDAQRASSANLMLMCYPHHIKTNDVGTYTVPMLQQMKADHEAKFTDIAQTIKDAITDVAASTKVHSASTYCAFMDHLDIGPVSSEQLAELKRNFQWMIDSVHSLPIRTRQLLAVIVSRLQRNRGNRFIETDEVWDRELPLQEIAEACHLTGRDVSEQVAIMERYDIAHQFREEEYPPYIDKIQLHYAPIGWWYPWGELKDFCTKSSIPIKALLVDLRFDLLD